MSAASPSVPCEYNSYLNGCGVREADAGSRDTVGRVINERLRYVWAAGASANRPNNEHGPMYRHGMLSARSASRSGNCVHTGESVRVGVGVRAVRWRTGMRLDPPAANDRLQGTVF